MIAVLRKLSTWSWWWRTVVTVRGQLQSSYRTQWKHLSRFSSSAHGRALAWSVLIHATLAVTAGMSVYQIQNDKLPSLNLAISDPEPNEFGHDQSFQILSEPDEVVPPAGGGSFGSPLTSLPVEPNIADPVGSLLAWDDSELRDQVDFAKAIGKPAELNGRGVGRGQGAGIGDGRGNGIGTGAGIGKRYFSIGSEGKRFVYVLDCSLSMNHPHDSDAKTRFNRMKLELMTSVSNLKPEQEFFIVFFNHEAIPMPADRPVSAAVENQQQFLAWAREVPATGDTDPTAALALALRMQPDVIYFLTDGSFSQPANEIVNAIQQTKSSIHTFSFSHHLTDKQSEGLELMRKGKMSSARLKLGENTYRRVREVFTAEKVMMSLSDRNSGKFQIIP